MYQMHECSQVIHSIVVVLLRQMPNRQYTSLLCRGAMCACACVRACVCVCVRASVCVTKCNSLSNINQDILLQLTSKEVHSTLSSAPDFKKVQELVVLKTLRFINWRGNYFTQWICCLCYKCEAVDNIHCKYRGKLRNCTNLQMWHSLLSAILQTFSTEF